MSSLNLCQFIGRLGQPPEVTFTQGGDAVCKISIAITDSWKNKDTGQQQEKTEWVRIVAFRGLAEVMGKYLKQGSLVYISGKMQTTSYEKDGSKRYSTEIVAKDMKMLSPKGENQSAPQNQSTPNVTQVDEGMDGLEEDIPF